VKISLKMAQMRPVARNITVRPVVPMAYLSAKERAPEEKKELIKDPVCAGLNGRLGSRAEQ